MDSVIITKRRGQNEAFSLFRVLALPKLGDPCKDILSKTIALFISVEGQCKITVLTPSLFRLVFPTAPVLMHV